LGQPIREELTGDAQCRSVFHEPNTMNVRDL
jgi:hypothetical protein